MCQCGNDPNANYCVNCQPGDPGDPGVSLAFIIDPEPAGANCPDGGWKVQVGVDSDLDGVPDTGIYTFYVQNGAPGLPGATPTFVTGTVTTLLPGASATAAVVPIGLNQYRIDLGVPKGDQGIPGPAQLLWGRTAFVDDLNGSDAGPTIGVVGDATKPFKTIQKANDMLIASGFVGSGLRGVIFLRNGSYSTTTGVVLNDWIDIYGDAFTIICTNVANPALTLGARSHVIGLGASIAHSVTGGKALYQSTFYSGRIFLNKTQGAIDINMGGSSAEIHIRDILPTSGVNVSSGFGDVASGNILLRNGFCKFTAVNCWSTVRVGDTGTSTVVTLVGDFKAGVWIENAARINSRNANITRNTAVTVAAVAYLTGTAVIDTFATRIEGTAATMDGIVLNAAGTKAILNSTVIIGFGGGSASISGNAAAQVLNYGATSANKPLTTVNEVFVGTQPVFVNALVV